jgi:hypothetical protein
VEEKENPLESLVLKLADRGLDADAAFEKFDFDGDGVLTLQEIKNGFRTLKIKLLPHEVQKLTDVIDTDCDGCVSKDEWIDCLTIKINAQERYFAIMGDVDIRDPLDLEEKILDMQFKKRQLDKEVRLMRKQQQADNYFKNAQIKDQAKMVGEKIKELEQKVQDKQNMSQHNKDDDLQVQLAKGPQTRADIESERESLQVVLAEVQIKYNEKKAEHDQAIFTLDDRMRTINETSEMIKCDRQLNKIKLRNLQKQLERDRQAEKDYDKEIETILGRAVTQADLDALYQQDLGLLNQIEAGFDNKIESYKQIIAAMKL